MDISRLLPNNEYQAAVGAASPSGANPFATIADITASVQNWQSVMDQGSSAGGLTTQVLVDTTQEILLLSDNFTTQGGFDADPTFAAFIKSDGIDTNLFIMTDASTTFTDDITSKGVVYSADYSANFTARSWTDKNYQDTHLGSKEVTALVTGPLVGQDGFVVTWDNTAGKYTLVASGGGNNIYNANDSLTGARTVTMGANSLTFSGNITTFKGINQLASTFSFRAENGDNSHNITYNNVGLLTNSGNNIAREYLTIGVSPGFGTFQFKGNSGNMGRILPQNLSGSMTFTTLGDNPTMTIFDKTGAVQTLIGSGGNNGSYFQLRVAFGHASPSVGIHSKNIDVLFEGLTDTNLFRVDNSADNVVIGAATGTSKLTVTGDVETIGNGLGVIVAQETSGTKYRIYVDASGSLAIQLA